MKYTFGDFEFDTERFELRRGNQIVEATPQVLSILQFLLVSRSRLITKDELVEEVWDGRAISDAAITVRIRALREAIGDNGKDQRLLRTIRGRGFRFVGDVGTTASRKTPVPQDPTQYGSEIDPIGQPTIAVLPFNSHVQGEDSALFSMAFPDEILTALSKLQSLVVKSRGSSYSIPSYSLSPREAGQQLGANYVVSGEIEMLARELAVSIELSDAPRNEAIWREVYRIGLEEVHDLRAEVVKLLAIQIETRISQNELARAQLKIPSELNAWRLFHLGVNATAFMTAGNFLEAEQKFRSAIELAPSFGRAHAAKSLLASSLAQRTWSIDGPERLRQAEQASSQAIAYDPLGALSHISQGGVAMLRGDEGIARNAFQRSVGLGPSEVRAHSSLARLEALTGNAQEAFKAIAQVELLSPKETNMPFNLCNRVLASLAKDDVSEAIKNARKLVALSVDQPQPMAIALAALGEGGAEDEVALLRQSMAQLYPDWDQRSFFKGYPLCHPE